MKQFLYLFGIAILVISCGKETGKKEAEKEQVNATKSSSPKELFTLKDPKESGLYFVNNVQETFEENYLNYEFFYNGSGVAVGDINNDGLPDIYFAGNSSDDKLYLNKGDMTFEDISTTSGIAGLQGWSTGVNMIDINADGWLDIYVCRSGPSKDISKRTNRLYINNKNNTFTEAAAQYGLKSTDYSIQSAFFDYDLDGDLDMYLLNHPDPKFKTKDAIQHMKDIKAGKIQTDIFYENINGKFVDRSRSANLVNFGYRHGIAIGDINKDGYPDLYISSDFEEPDVLCINQGDKTFKNEIEDYFRHISYNSMGNEMVDINNDGLLDVFVVDMAIADHFRSKAYMASMNVKKFNVLKNNGYHSQYMFNTLHVNNGNDTYSEIAQLSGIAKTDWSWAPLFFDMDQDGYKDLFITNGIKENFLYRDLQAEADKKKNETGSISLDDLLNIVPSDISENIFYKNEGGLKFKDVSGEWAKPSLYNSNGVATADFDNDGDLDFVTNNMGSNASLYENKAANGIGGNFVKLLLKGEPKNPQAIGTKVEVSTSDGRQWQELYTTRGYLSSVDHPLVFGLDDNVTAEVSVIWPDRTASNFTMKANSTRTVYYASSERVAYTPSNNSEALLTEVLNSGVDFRHEEDQINDYKQQVLLPHSQSNVGPSLAKADVNGDGLEDLFIGGAAGQAGVLYVQNNTGSFSRKTGPWQKDAAFEDTGAIFFDSDGDGDQDLYVVSGGTHLPFNSNGYQDRLYINQGNGNFSKGTLPKMTESGAPVVAADIDKDGDQDLFVGGRIIPDKYPYAPKSYLLVNNNGTFTKNEIAIDQMVSAALFTDYDKDGDEDLMIVGEWSAITIFKNDAGTFSKANIPSLEKTVGLWFGLAERDMDNDGDMDYFAGNLGLNTKFKASEKKAFHVYCDDFDQNGTYDVVLSSNYNGKLVPSRGRECSSEQMPFIQEKFKDYRSFASASLQDIYGDQLETALHYEANMLHSVYLENKGDGSFAIRQLPLKAQYGPVSDFAFADIDNDGKEEVLLVGNLFNVEVETMRYDAARGTVLDFDGSKFSTLNSSDTGFVTSGDARNIAILNRMILVTNNDGKMDVFKI
ncbi:VCBS repeat-containing protein [Sungkyunkwania multivorans]|uniref:VCBS repeat-containing protein n=1 Tax=Sungkyunkwania multivorans TaxID=1173618 RepID=A0ABW3CUF7_9FLAO